MFKKGNSFFSHEVKKRYRLYKSGKHWVTADNSEHLLHFIGRKIETTETFDREELDKGHSIARQLAIAGQLALGASVAFTAQDKVYADEYTDNNNIRNSVGGIIGFLALIMSLAGILA